jgi:hypothetical protein
LNQAYIRDLLKDHIKSEVEAMPMVTKQYDLKPDMKFGWKPKENTAGAPIPLFYDYEEF